MLNSRGWFYAVRNGSFESGMNKIRPQELFAMSGAGIITNKWFSTAMSAFPTYSGSFAARSGRVTAFSDKCPRNLIRACHQVVSDKGGRYHSPGCQTGITSAPVGM
jgi:hypothetical protein